MNFYTPLNEVRGGGDTGITLPVCLSVRLSVDARAVRYNRAVRNWLPRGYFVPLGQPHSS